MDTVSRLAKRHQIDLFCPSVANTDFCDIQPYVSTTHVFPYCAGRDFKSPFGRLNEAVRLTNVWHMERLARHAAAMIDAGGYDVVLVHPCSVTQAPSILPFLRTPSVYYCHEPMRGLYEPAITRPYDKPSRSRRTFDRVDPLRALHHMILGRTDRRNTRAATVVLTNSRFTRNAIKRIYQVDACVNRPGVDAEFFKPTDNARQAFVTSVGALQPSKGFDLVIDALATLPNSTRPTLEVISNSELEGERHFLERRACDLGVSVRFRTGIDHRTLVEAYARSQLTVYAPIREPLGLVALESQACKTPVVAVAEGGMLETIVPDRTGILVRRDAEALGGAIQSLLGDRARLDELGHAGRAHVAEHWSWEQCVIDQEAWLARAATGNKSLSETIAS
jgi:glycosyltransferase involved in cell wall biosynthesis